jgi:hypothetical protein
MTINDPEIRNRPSRSAMGGGIFLFVGLLVGSIVGISINQTSLGMMAGFGIGAVLAILLWFADRAK